MNPEKEPVNNSEGEMEQREGPMDFNREVEDPVEILRQARERIDGLKDQMVDLNNSEEAKKYYEEIRRIEDKAKAKIVENARKKKGVVEEE